MEISEKTAKKVIEAICHSPTNEDIKLAMSIAKESRDVYEFASNMCDTWEIQKRGNRAAIKKAVLEDIEVNH